MSEKLRINPNWQEVEHRFIDPQSPIRTQFAEEFALLKNRRRNSEIWNISAKNILHERDDLVQITIGELLQNPQTFHQYLEGETRRKRTRAEDRQDVADWLKSQAISPHQALLVEVTNSPSRILPVDAEEELMLVIDQIIDRILPGDKSFREFYGLESGIEELVSEIVKKHNIPESTLRYRLSSAKVQLGQDVEVLEYKLLSQTSFGGEHGGVFVKDFKSYIPFKNLQQALHDHLEEKKRELAKGKASDQDIIDVEQTIIIINELNIASIPQLLQLEPHILNLPMQKTIREFLTYLYGTSSKREELLTTITGVKQLEGIADPVIGQRMTQSEHIISDEESLRVLGIHDQLQKRLERSRITNIGELLKLSQKDILYIRGIGPNGVEEVVKALARFGLTLKEEEK